MPDSRDKKAKTYKKVWLCIVIVWIAVCVFLQIATTIILIDRYGIGGWLSLIPLGIFLLSKCPARVVAVVLLSSLIILGLALTTSTF